MPHMNQERTAPLAPNLDALRSEIDRIDDALLELVEQRLAASLAIAARKDADGDRLLKLRPRREARRHGERGAVRRMRAESDQHCEHASTHRDLGPAVPGQRLRGRTHR